ncbi:hypothetical protein FRUB_05338 [Fimbriiglobus ruber]|uniref:DUF1570 domain-containing protein n=2 Tax=Fimbriiglobus ruber TaxID=1908690 RepID=A0A225DTB4_9BACT|nr:hypothetical protein FRUB_05338 [Fimbriiglobus ruber]
MKYGRCTRRVWLVAATILVLTPAAATAQPKPVAGDSWAFDVVTLKNGATFPGMILTETPTGIEFQIVRRWVGRPAYTLTTRFDRRDVADVKKLSPAARAALREKVADIDPISERRRMDALELAATDWLGAPGGAVRYDAEHFILVSGAPDEVTRQAAVRLEQIFTAFARVFPPRHQAAQPVTIYLAAQMDDYRRLIGPSAGSLLNLAIYDPAANRVVCGSDLRRLGDKLTATQKQSKSQRAEIAKREAELRQLYKNSKPDLDRFLQDLNHSRDRLREADAANNRLFDRATQRLFALLYHEAFHAYIGTFVYPPLSPADVRAGKGTGELPRWLNEGFAQVYETALLEANELRIGHVDGARLDRVRKLLAAKDGPGLVPLADLLRAGKDTFLAMHADQRASADRAYLTSWAVTFYLTFGARTMDKTTALDAYVTTVSGGGDPVAAFQTWTGKDTAAFDKDLRDYLARLQPDGTVAVKRP